MQRLEPRIIWGYEILVKGDEPKQLDDSTFQVPSQSGNGVYLVSLIDGEWRCECPDHIYRLVECKHIHAVKFWLALKDQIVSEVEETIPEIACPLCGSEEVKKNGSRTTKVGKRQRYRLINVMSAFRTEEIIPDHDQVEA